MNLFDSDATFCEELETLLSGGQRMDLTPTQAKSSTNQSTGSQNTSQAASDQAKNSQRASQQTNSQTKKAEEAKRNAMISQSQKTSENEIIPCTNSDVQSEMSAKQDNKAILSYCRKKIKEIQGRIKQNNISEQETPIFEKELIEMKQKVDNKRVQVSIDSTIRRLQDLIDSDQEMPSAQSSRKRKLDESDKRKPKRRRAKKYTKSRDDSDGLIHLNVSSNNNSELNNDNSILVHKEAIEPYKQSESKEAEMLNEIMERAKGVYEKYLQSLICQPQTEPESAAAAQTETSDKQPIALKAAISESLFSDTGQTPIIDKNKSFFDSSGALLGQRCDRSFMEYDNIMQTSFRPHHYSTPSYIMFSMSPSVSDMNAANESAPCHRYQFGLLSDVENTDPVPRDVYSYENDSGVAEINAKNQDAIKTSSNAVCDTSLFFNPLHLQLLAKRLYLNEEFLKISLIETFQKAEELQQQENQKKVFKDAQKNTSVDDADSESDIPCSQSTNPYEVLKEKRMERKSRYSNAEMNFPTCFSKLSDQTEK